MKKTMMLLVGATLLFSTVACKKYNKYDDKEVLDNTYTGNIELQGVAEARGDFQGNGDSGTFSFVWDNAEEQATVNFDVTTTEGGTCQIILNDAKGDEVFNKTVPTEDDDTFSGTSTVGKKGKWLVTINLSNFNGDGTYDIAPKIN